MITPQDVVHIAALARVALNPMRTSEVAEQLTGILAHMEVLRAVDTSAVSPAVGIGAGGMALRPDTGGCLPLVYPREAFAPAMREGYFLVPRLVTHATHIGEVGARNADNGGE